MKRTVAILLAAMICISLACPVLAADIFVPSIDYKEYPEIVETPDGNSGEVIDGETGEVVDEVSKECLIITPVSEAKTSTQIPEEARQQLLDVYEQLEDGSMKIPYAQLDPSLQDKDMVIRDLFDITLLCDDVIKQLEDGAQLRIEFDLDLDDNTEVTVTTYHNGEWILVPAEKTENGTLIITLSNTGVVAFSVPVATTKPPVQTGDMANLALWGVLLAVSAAAVVVLLVSRRKIVR